MARFTGHRTLNWAIYAIYLILLLLSIVVLGVAVDEAHKLNDQLKCSTVPKLSYNIAAAAISILLFIVLLIFDNPSWSPRNKVKALKLGAWWRLLVLAILLVLWAVAAGVSRYNCSDLCNACSSAVAIVYAGMFCACSDVIFNPGGGFGNPFTARNARMMIKRQQTFTSTRVGDYYYNKRVIDITNTGLVSIAILIAIAMLLASDRPPPPRANTDRTGPVISNAAPGELRRGEVELQRPREPEVHQGQHLAPQYEPSGSAAHYHQHVEPPSYKQTMS